MKKLIIISVLVLLILAVGIIAMTMQSARRRHREIMEEGNISVPTERTYIPKDHSKFQSQLFNYWTEHKINNWTEGEKVNFKVARIVISNLLIGNRVDEINQYLLKQEATGVPGSRWLLNPRGDYDFTTMGFTPLIYMFDNQPDRLYPKTIEHVTDHILTIEGDGFSIKVPRAFIEDSENHVLMAESSRYLKNQWLWQHGNKSPKYDNKTNSVEKGLVEYLKNIDRCGIYEFNSEPYQGYAFSALLNLEAFATGEVQILARRILDRANWQYALGSYRFKHFPPYRRRFGKTFRKGLDVDYHTAMIKAWTSFYADSLDLKIERGQHHALWAAMMPYRPPDKVIDWTLRKPHPYFVKIGHGTNSCPEIYSGDTEYLLSAGGANRGRHSLIMPKPITLLLDDNADSLSDVFHMYGPGKDPMDWNNSGVYKRFACTAGPVHVPKAYMPLAQDANWKIFKIGEHRLLAIYSNDHLGIFYIHHHDDAAALLKKMIEKNPDATILHTAFSYPDGSRIAYDLQSKHDQWVITIINNEKQHRQFDSWPAFEGDLNIQ